MSRRNIKFLYNMEIAISRYRKIQIHWFTSTVKSCVIMF